MNDCCPFTSRVTRPLADDRVSEKAGETWIGDPEVVTHTPFDKYAEVTEYAADSSANSGSLGRC